MATYNPCAKHDPLKKPCGPIRRREGGYFKQRVCINPANDCGNTEGKDGTGWPSLRNGYINSLREPFGVDAQTWAMGSNPQYVKVAQATPYRKAMKLGLDKMQVLGEGGAVKDEETKEAAGGDSEFIVANREEDRVELKRLANEILIEAPKKVQDLQSNVVRVQAMIRGKTDEQKREAFAAVPALAMVKVEERLKDATVLMKDTDSKKNIFEWNAWAKRISALHNIKPDDGEFARLRELLNEAAADVGPADSSAAGAAPINIDDLPIAPGGADAGAAEGKAEGKADASAARAAATAAEAAAAAAAKAAAAAAEAKDDEDKKAKDAEAAEQAAKAKAAAEKAAREAAKGGSDAAKEAARRARAAAANAAAKVKSRQQARKLDVDVVNKYKAGDKAGKTTTKQGKASKLFDALEAEEDQAEQSKLNVRIRQREFRNMVAKLEQDLEKTKEKLAEALKAEVTRREAVNAGVVEETENRYNMYKGGFMALWWYMQKYLFGVKRDAKGEKYSGEPRMTATWSGYPTAFFSENRHQMWKGTEKDKLRWVGDVQDLNGNYTIEKPIAGIWTGRGPLYPKNKGTKVGKIYLYKRTWDDFKKMRVQKKKVAKDALEKEIADL